MDLNLIRVFVAVFEAQSLTATAERLHVTQPAVSQALGRLRRELSDPLFTREGRTMQPTPLAVSIYPGFREAIVGIDRTLDGIDGFDPTTTHRRYCIALSELGEIGYLPSILRAVRHAAPHARIDTVPLDVRALPEWLARGDIDLAVTSSPLPGGFEHTVLKSQGYTVLMAAAHPLASSDLSLEDYIAANHVVVAGDSGLPQLRAALRRQGAVVQAEVTLNHFAALPGVLASSADLIATAPDTIAEGWAQAWPLALRALPLDMPTVDVCLYRRSTTPQLAALDWLYDTVVRAVRGTHGEFFSIHGKAGAGNR